MSEKLRKGDRVRPTKAGIAINKRSDLTGRLTSDEGTIKGDCVRVKWDQYVEPQTLHRKFVEKIDG